MITNRIRECADDITGIAQRDGTPGDKTAAINARIDRFFDDLADHLKGSPGQDGKNTGGRQMSDNVVTLFPARTPQAARAIDAALDAVDQATLTEEDREVIIAAVIRGLATLGSNRLVYVAG